MDKTFNMVAGWMIDGTGSAAQKDILLRVEDGIIASVGHAKSGNATSRPGMQSLDLSACTILPGLVDSHVHLTLSGTLDQELRRRQLSFSFERSRPLIEERIAKHLRRGILALRDGGDCGGHVLRFKIEHHPNPGGQCPIHLKSAGRGWRAKGRYGKLIGDPPAEGVSLAECISRGTDPIDHVKIINSGLNSLTEFGKQTSPQFSSDELRAAVKAARERGLKTMVHANGVVPVREAIEAGCDSIEHGFFMGRENLERMVERQVVWVPTAFSMKAFLSYALSGSVEADTAARNLEHKMEQLASARKMGVRIAMGTDAGGFGIKHGSALIEEFRIFLDAGFSVEEVARCASLEGAGLLGIENEIGTIGAGSPATFVAVPGPPSHLPDSLDSARAVYARGIKIHSIAPSPSA